MGPREIKRIRLFMGWSQERLAREVGVSFCTVNRWENGKTAPSPMAIKIMKTLVEEASIPEKRRDLRVVLHCPINIRFLNRDTLAPELNKNTVFSASTENLSPGGLMFTTRKLVRAGELLGIDLNIDERNLIKTVSEVIWTASGGNGKKVGVRFNVRDRKKMISAMTARGISSGNL